MAVVPVAVSLSSVVVAGFVVAGFVIVDVPFAAVVPPTILKILLF